MDTERADAGLPEGFAEDAWVALSLMGTFAACDWYDARDEKRAAPGTGKARSRTA